MRKKGEMKARVKRKVVSRWGEGGKRAGRPSVLLLRLSGALHLQAHNQHRPFLAIRAEERGKVEEEEEVFH